MNTIFSVAIFFTSATFCFAAAQPVSEDEIIDAFLNNPEISVAHDNFGDTIQRDPPSIYYWEGMCGAVGCSYSVLVVQEFQSEKGQVNPWTRQLLGLVRISTSGEIQSVKRVKLVPYHENAGDVDGGK